MTTPNEKPEKPKTGRIEAVFCEVCGAIGAVWMIVSGIYALFSGYLWEESFSEHSGFIGFLYFLVTLIAWPIMVLLMAKFFAWIGRILFGIVNSVLNLE